MVPSEYLFPDDHTLSENNVNCTESGTSCFFKRLSCNNKMRVVLVENRLFKR